jgi:CHAT domain-containing protein
LTMREVFDLKLNAELVVLSACKTGLGKIIRGEGITGLSRAFLCAGTPTVLVSLWNVYDRSTADLMTSFYKNLETQGMNKAAALREARLEMIRSKKYSHPYYWAPFVLIGDH